MGSSHDPFDDLLNLEEEYYKEGYEEGLKDGAESGRIEGYSLGLQKGFEKFVETGRLQSRAVVWANRIPKYQQRQQQQHNAVPEQQSQNDPTELAEKRVESEISKTHLQLPPIHSNPRLEKNIETLYGLVEPGTLSTNNDDESVNDFDSRMKGAHGKLRMIERAVGEGTTSRYPATQSSPPNRNENIEDVGKIQPAVKMNLADV
ncbi:hypothetical protein NUW58_g10417 [Xylaria curta]|uniref:Uncharacterized protein n=1 Tax=Xylaria curta TaxID=42375 RepID=A0ACC1MLL9_9PEZI|nr:hypothetical protein NUW58_g10417 [Xylaria curta]